MGGRPQYNVWIRLDRLQFSSSLALLSLVAVALSVFSPWFLLVLRLPVHFRHCRHVRL
jgi:hypothetical protein